MWKIDWIPLGFGLLMAGIDVITFGMIKTISLDGTRMIRWMIVPTLFYAIQPWLFLQSLKFETLVITNLLWDVLSDVFVTLMGLVYFGEKLGFYKRIGVVLSLVSVFLLTAADGDGL
jgi:multidrug transporter EmrE-like cation transporter